MTVIRWLIDLGFTLWAMPMAVTIFLLALVFVPDVYEGIETRFARMRRASRWILSIPISFLVAFVAAALVYLLVRILPISPTWLEQFVAMTAGGVVARIYLLGGFFSLFPRPIIPVALLLVDDARWLIGSAMAIAQQTPGLDQAQAASQIVTALCTFAGCVWLARAAGAAAPKPSAARIAAGLSPPRF